MNETQASDSIYEIQMRAQHSAFMDRDGEAKADAALSPAAIPVDLYAPEAYFNRELSWLDFNWRVLNEALNPDIPLLERMKFIAITASNLDEFFMIRVAGLKQQIELGVTDLPSDGMTAEVTIDAIREEVCRMNTAASDCFYRDILPILEQEGVYLHTYERLDVPSRKWCDTYFIEQVFPILSPLAIDSGHPFPHLINRSLNLILTVVDPTQSQERIAVVQVPPIVPRLVAIPVTKDGYHFVLLDEVIAANANALFTGLSVRDWHRFRVTRNADLDIADDEASDLLTTIEEQVRRRRWGAVVRMEVDRDIPMRMLQMLQRSLHLADRDVYKVDGPLNLADFMTLTSLPLPHLKDPRFAPRIAAELRVAEDIFKRVKDNDILFHHPYDSFSPIVDFIDTAADDPAVLAIKQTLYRTNGDSNIVKALARAAENGKQVTAFIELKARFDEENNIIWARQLEQAGVHVVYGIIGLKTHCKLSLVVRREKGHLQTYVHISSGNYNEITSRVYTDYGLLSCRKDLAFEASELFNYLTGYSHQTEWNKIIVAPISLRQKLLALIQRETDLQKSGGAGRIIAKMNALVDPQIIRALYRASIAGVQIDLIVRGICCLRPGVPGLSENIRVRSIVGRFLEHSRVFVFGNGGNPEIYGGSADWMPRNLNRRVEAMFMIEDAVICDRILNHILPTILADNEKSYELQADGSYIRPQVDTTQSRVNSQETFIRYAEIASRDPDTFDEV